MRKILSFFTAILFAGSMMAANYELVTAASQLEAGAKYVIGTAAGKFIATTSNANNRKITDATVTDGVVEATDAVMVFTLGGSADAWTFATENYAGAAGYLNATNTTGSNNLKVVADLDDYAYFTIAIADGVTTITCNGKTSRNILYQNGSTCFSCYNEQTSAQYIKPSLYKEVSSTPQTSYTVAGSSDVAFGTAWDPTNKANDMKLQADGSYKWEKTGLELAAGSVDFKVCKDHDWDVAYPSDNYQLSIAESGVYTITITYEPANENKVSAVATKTADLVVLPTVVLHGNFAGEWADTDPFTAAEDKLTAELKLTLAEGAYEFGFKFDGAWKANGATITRENPTTSLAEGNGNMKITADQAGEYVLTYTFATEELAVAYPKKQAVLPAGAYMLTFKGTGDNTDKSNEFKKDDDIFTDECKAYVASVDTISKVYAARIIDENTSSLKFGTTSVKGYLQFTLATPVEVDSIIVNATQYGKNAAEVTVNGTKFDLTAGNKVPTDCKITPEGKVSAITIAQTGSERIYLRYVTVYPKQGGEEPVVEPEVKLPVVAIAGTMNEWSAEANVMVAAEDSLSASVKIALEAQDYAFKIVSDGKWLSLNGEGESLYRIHREWNEVAHINGVDIRNFALAADVAGEYTFTWTYADSTLVVTFPEKSEEPAVTDQVLFSAKVIATANQSFEPGTTVISAEQATITGGSMSVISEQTSAKNLIATQNSVYYFTMTNNNTFFKVELNQALAVGDVISADVLANGAGESNKRGIWVSTEESRPSEAPAAALTAIAEAKENVNVKYTVAEEDEYVGKKVLYIYRETSNSTYFDAFKVTRAAGEEPVVETADFYIAGTMTDWADNKIAVTGTSYKLNLEAGDYMLKVIVGEGEAAQWKGFDALTTVANGLTRGSGENEDNICFTLTEAGEVNVHYDGEYFFLNGEFYVAPVEVKYYLKNNWDGGEWTWKEMTALNDGTYMLYNVVVGGEGVNRNTAESDEGASWFAWADIETFDASFAPATIGALDTVVIYFDPEAVNSFTGANGMSAQILGKYVAPVVETPDFYIAGTMTDWADNKIAVTGTSYKLNLEAGDYMLKVIVGEGEAAQWKGFDALTTVANGLTRGSGENEDNICFTLTEAGEVNVHYDGEYFFLNGEFYVAPVEVKYYLKNNWDGGEWTWKEMTKDEYGTYMLGPVVFGGTGVNINTNTESDGSWIAMADITAFDASYEPATLGALDTVVFMFDPEEVNSFTGANGLSALITGKYVAPVEPTEHTYTVAGNLMVAFGTAWDPANAANDMVKQEDGTYKWEKAELVLPAGTVQFKVCEDHAWAVAYPAQDYQLAIPEAGEYTLTITFDPATQTVAANAEKTGTAEVDPTVSAKGSWDEWANELIFTLAADKATASLTVNNVKAGTYEFKVILNGGEWRSNGYKFTREATSVEGITGNDNANMKLVADVDGTYTFTWTFATNALNITFPAAGPTALDNINADGKAVKVLRNGQILIKKGDKTYNVMGAIVR